MSTDSYVVVFVARQYEFSPRTPDRLVYGPDSKYNCEQHMKMLDRDGGPGGGFHTIKPATVQVTW